MQRTDKLFKTCTHLLTGKWIFGRLFTLSHLYLHHNFIIQGLASIYRDGYSITVSLIPFIYCVRYPRFLFSLPKYLGFLLTIFVAEFEIRYPPLTLLILGYLHFVL